MIDTRSSAEFSEPTPERLYREQIEALRAAIRHHRANLWGDGSIGHDEDAALYRSAGLPDVVEQVETDPDDRPAGPIIEMRPVNR